MKKYIYISILGAFGAIARYTLEKAPIIISGISSPTSSYLQNFPINTLIINTLGCFALSFIIDFSFEKKHLSNAVRLGITTGFLGAFTTFSTLCKESTELFRLGEYGVGLSYIIVSVFLGLLSVFLANRLAKHIGKTIISNGGAKQWN
jgi:CrcB protein